MHYYQVYNEISRYVSFVAERKSGRAYFVTCYFGAVLRREVFKASLLRWNNFKLKPGESKRDPINPNNIVTRISKAAFVSACGDPKKRRS